MEKSEIIRRLEKIASHAVHVVGEKPFVMSLYDGIAVYDAIALLKEQEPKLLTFDEVKKHFLVPKELFGSIEEYIDYVNDIEPLYLECNVEDAFVFHWRTHNDISMHLDDWKNEYGKTWRCWTKKPTHEQMKAVKWEC